MKIETDISNDFFHCFDEARGVAQHKAKFYRQNQQDHYLICKEKLLPFVFYCL